MTEKIALERHQYHAGGRLIYEWDQTLTDLNIYIEVPAGVAAKNLAINIKPRQLSIGIAGNPPYLEKEFCKQVVPAESFWTLDKTTLSLQLCKAQTGEPWAAAFAGHEVGVLEQQEEQRRLMLERFQTEVCVGCHGGQFSLQELCTHRKHPGFDFSNATFSGEAPNPRTFMGGMSRQ